MPIKTTMTGSWPRTQEIMQLLGVSRLGEVPIEHHSAIESAETRAIRDQLHPGDLEYGLDWISNGEQRKAGYTFYLPNRFAVFSKTEKVTPPLSKTFVEEMSESNPMMLETNRRKSFSIPMIESRLQYVGWELARREAEDAVRLAKPEGAKRIFVNSPSPGTIAIFFSRNRTVYHDHYDYLFDLGKEIRKEYETILSVVGVDL